MPVSFGRLSTPQWRTTYPGIYMGGPCWDKKRHKVWWMGKGDGRTGRTGGEYGPQRTNTNLKPTVKM